MLTEIPRLDRRRRLRKSSSVCLSWARLAASCEFDATGNLAPWMKLRNPCSDMSPQHDIFNQAIERFTAEQEEVRTAAAFAAGNIAVGNLHHFLPVIVKMVETDQAKRLLSLHALKEVR